MCSSVLQCAAVYCSVLQSVGLSYSVVQCTAVCCRVLQCVCSVLQCVAVCCTMGWLRLGGSLRLWVSFAKEPYKIDCILQNRPTITRSPLMVVTPYVTASCSVLQCVAVCCSVLQFAAACCSASQSVALCYSVVQCAAVCCSVLQCVAVRCSVAPFPPQISHYV